MRFRVVSTLILILVLIGCYLVFNNDQPTQPKSQDDGQGLVIH